jgi:hypothetical protein
MSTHGIVLTDMLLGVGTDEERGGTTRECGKWS